MRIAEESWRNIAMHSDCARADWAGCRIFSPHFRMGNLFPLCFYSGNAIVQEYHSDVNRSCLLHAGFHGSDTVMGSVLYGSYIDVIVTRQGLAYWMNDIELCELLRPIILGVISIHCIYNTHQSNNLVHSVILFSRITTINQATALYYYQLSWTHGQYLVWY